MNRQKCVIGLVSSALIAFNMMLISAGIVFAGDLQVSEQSLIALSPTGQEMTVYLPGHVPMVLLKIPAGSFQMGSPGTERGRNADEGPVHQVNISQAFYMGKTEVTQEQWQAVMGSAMPSTCGNAGYGATYPVYCISWNDVEGPAGFIEKLNQYLGTTRFHLPSEAQWEYAARGNTTGRFSFGDSLSCDDSCGSCSLAAQYMWWCSDSGSTSHPVSSLLPNPFGLFDMHGNLYEWCHDWYGPYTADAQTDPTGPGTGSGRVIRGGYWDNHAQLCRSAYRSADYPTTRGTLCGFRIMATDESSCTLSCTAFAAPSSGQAPLSVIFTSTVIPAGNCTDSPIHSWSFGDGQVSSLQNPNHTYVSTGNMNWTYSVTQAGVSCNQSGTINVLASGGNLPGDCDGNGTVTIGEVQKAINAFLGLGGTCP